MNCLTAICDDNGNVTDRIEYSVYGLTTYRIGSTDTPFQFGGRYGVMTDSSGLLYMRSRFYNPYLCRFINPDPSGFAGGLNFYAYAGGNPVTYIDPLGLGAMGDSQLSSWLNPSPFLNDEVYTQFAPTAAEKQAEQVEADFVNFATLGILPHFTSLSTKSGAATSSHARFSRPHVTLYFLARLVHKPMGQMQSEGLNPRAQLIQSKPKLL
jgi:RHS repeat-associated protein